jgi:hypothetical protein
VEDNHSDKKLERDTGELSAGIEIVINDHPRPPRWYFGTYSGWDIHWPTHTEPTFSAASLARGVG